MKKDQLFITEDELLENASKLTSITNQLKLISRLIENVEYARVSGDEPTVFYQINSGLLGIINEGLADIQEVIKGFRMKFAQTKEIRL